MLCLNKQNWQFDNNYRYYYSIFEYYHGLLLFYFILFADEQKDKKGEPFYILTRPRKQFHLLDDKG